MKNAVIYDFNVHHYDIRDVFLKETLKKAGYDTDIVMADFDHNAKAYVTHRHDGVTYLHASAYTKNLSAARIMSLLNFTHDCQKHAEAHHYDLIYCLVPPNSFVKRFSAYKKKHPEVKLIYEIDDVWPETFPYKNHQALLKVPFALWRNMRNAALHDGDLVITECDYFKEIIGREIALPECETVYFNKEQAVKEAAAKPKDPVHLLYLGSINHIIDIDGIVGFLQPLGKKITLDIVGSGEGQEAFLRALEEAHIPYTYHGPVYDEAKKREIFSQCAYGINMMKDTVRVGLTMKSLDYLSYGLPLINNIPGDTEKLVREEKIGFNTKETDPLRLLNLREDEYLAMCRNVIRTDHDLFTPEANAEKLLSLLKRL